MPTISSRYLILKDPFAEACRSAIRGLMERAGPLCGLSAPSAFQRWLALIESDICCPIAGCGRLIPDHACDQAHACRALRTAQWDQCAHGLDAAMPLFTEALGHLYRHYREAYEDVLGPVFEQLGLGGNGGMFFTPWHLAKAIAALQGSLLDKVEHQEAIRVSDPTCGSGVLLLAFFEYVAFHRPDLLPRIRPMGHDRNADCVRMCRISLRLVAIGRAEYLARAAEEDDAPPALTLRGPAAPVSDKHAATGEDIPSAEPPSSSPNR